MQTNNLENHDPEVRELLKKIPPATRRWSIGVLVAVTLLLAAGAYLFASI